MIQPSFIIQNFATCYYYFPEWTCLYLERNFINTSEKAQKFREEARRNTKGLGIKDKDRPRDILQKIMEKNKLPTDSKMLRLMIKKNSLTFKRRSRTASKTNSRHGKKKTRSRSVKKKKKGFLNTIKSYIFGNPQDIAINKQKYIERSLVVIFILGFLGVGIHHIHKLEDKLISEQENNRKLETEKISLKGKFQTLADEKLGLSLKNYDLENKNQEHEKRLKFTFGKEKYEYLMDSAGNYFNVQRQYEGNCQIHAVNNFFSGRVINNKWNAFDNPVSLMQWATITAGVKKRSDDHYMKGGYNQYELLKFLEYHNLNYIEMCNNEFKNIKRSEFIENYVDAYYGLLFSVTGHALCIRKHNIRDSSSTYIDSNYLDKMQALKDAADVYDFIFIREDWKEEYIADSKVEILTFVTFKLY